MTAFIEVNNLSHSFGAKRVLDSLSFQAGKGEITGLLGPSGAGKTTLVNLLTGQLKPDEGEIRICGNNRQSQGERWGNRPGIMMDSFGLYERMSVYDNLKIYAGIYRVPLKRIDGLLEKAGLAQAKKTVVGRLSKGMRSRVNFCRALLRETDILYLDEPTSGLDPATTEKIHEMMLEEKSAGTTIFLTTHNMHEAERLCDKVLLLNEGRIVENGAPKEICRKYNFQNKIEVVLKNGEVHTVKNTGENARTVAMAMEKWLSDEAVVSIHSSEPDLEKVFLSITGRRLWE